MEYFFSNFFFWSQFYFCEWWILQPHLPHHLASGVLTPGMNIFINNQIFNHYGKKFNFQWDSHSWAVQSSNELMLSRTQRPTSSSSPMVQRQELLQWRAFLSILWWAMSLALMVSLSGFCMRKVRVVHLYLQHSNEGVLCTLFFLLGINSFNPLSINSN